MQPTTAPNVNAAHGTFAEDLFYCSKSRRKRENGEITTEKHELLLRLKRKSSFKREATKGKKHVFLEGKIRN